MSNVFVVSLNFKNMILGGGAEVEEEYDEWLLGQKGDEVKEVKEPAWEEDVGDSGCWGSRTVDVGLDCVWKMHGGI
jgi:hypothetical protein